jgi:hypothetical protein
MQTRLSEIRHPVRDESYFEKLTTLPMQKVKIHGQKNIGWCCSGARNNLFFFLLLDITIFVSVKNLK